MIPYFDGPSISFWGLEFDLFGFLVATGFIVGTLLAARRARIVGLNEKVMYNLGLLALCFGILFAHLTVVFIYHPEEIILRPLWLFQVWSGISSWGGFLGAGLAIYLYMRRHKLPFLKYADALMFGLLPGWFFGRMGCFTVHDHPGRRTTFFLSVRYPNFARHDLGLDEMLMTIPMILVVYYLGRKKNQNDPPPGSIYAVTLMMYAVARFCLDFLRSADIARVAEKRFGGFTVAQFVCVAMFGFGVYLFRRVNRST